MSLLTRVYWFLFNLVECFEAIHHFENIANLHKEDD